MDLMTFMWAFGFFGLLFFIVLLFKLDRVEKLLKKMGKADKKEEPK